MSDPVLEVEATDNLEVPYDTSDPVQVNKARKRASRTRAERLHFVSAAMGTEQGRSWFYDILNRCHIFNRSFDPDPYIHAYKAGEVNVGLMLLSDIQDAAPENYIKMVSENKTK